MPRLLVVLLAPMLGAAMLAAACGGSDGADEDTSSSAWSADAIQKSQTDAQLQVVQVNSQIGQGQARVAFGILKPDPKDPNSANLVHNATARVKLYKLDGEDNGVAAGEYDLTPVTLREGLTHTHADGTTETHDDPLATVYVVNVNLDKTDWWGADLSIRFDDKQYDGVKMRFFVSEKTSEPGIGDAVPPSTQLTTGDVPDVAMIDSSTPPRPQLHEMTVAEAVKNGKPSLIAFATPAFCQTRFCGPVVDTVVAPLYEKYRDRVNFLHIEPYDLAKARQGTLVPIPEMQQWGLVTEPWVFVLDATGHVAAKFEGIMSEEEVEPALQQALGSS